MTSASPYWLSIAASGSDNHCRERGRPRAVGPQEVRCIIGPAACSFKQMSYCWPPARIHGWFYLIEIKLLLAGAPGSLLLPCTSCSCAVKHALRLAETDPAPLSDRAHYQGNKQSTQCLPAKAGSFHCAPRSQGSVRLFGAMDKRN